jgi:FMN phosphatase YigB (HAD superfamily)
MYTDIASSSLRELDAVALATNGTVFMKRGTKAIFLDVGGTLLEMGDPESAYADILGQYGYSATREEIGAWIRTAQEETGPVVSSGSGARFKVSASKEQARREDLIGVFLREAGVKKHLDSCRKEIWDSWVKAPVFRLFPETLPLLKGLKESGFLVGAVSNWEPRLQELCENLGIARYFDFMVVSEAQPSRGCDCSSWHLREPQPGRRKSSTWGTILWKTSNLRSHWVFEPC